MGDWRSLYAELVKRQPRKRDVLERKRCSSYRCEICGLLSDFYADRKLVPNMESANERSDYKRQLLEGEKLRWCRSHLGNEQDGVDQIIEKALGILEMERNEVSIGFGRNMKKTESWLIVSSRVADDKSEDQKERVVEMQKNNTKVVKLEDSSNDFTEAADEKGNELMYTPRKIVKRRCQRCGLLAVSHCRFPTNLRVEKQQLWIDSLGLDEDSARKELARHRKLWEKNREPRWCKRHFTPDGTPIPVESHISVEFDERKVKEELAEEAEEDIIAPSSSQFDEKVKMEENDEEKAANDRPPDCKEELIDMEIERLREEQVESEGLMKEEMKDEIQTGVKAPGQEIHPIGEMEERPLAVLRSDTGGMSHVECKKCTALFQDLNDYNKHKSTCGRSFGDSKNMKVTVFHTRKRSTIETANLRMKHQTISSAMNGMSRITCEICQIENLTHTSLIFHMKTHPLYFFRYECKGCNFTAKKPGLFQKHLQDAYNKSEFFCISPGRIKFIKKNIFAPYR